ncbi:cyclase family protein [Streptomyces gilvus]|uniref:cyclase family protein n=1 Tax=Streptomyces gilvus TaxID=2920937 RepID=UPI001F0F2499|nr:cyclase family protein [Streptomyces sp. CME 23]MCH5677585.1 cyclase family protein [Streptomyces sp. CME 23]
MDPEQDGAAGKAGAGERGGPAWGRWGEDDERGALNLLTPERVVAAAGRVRTGRVYPLGLPIQRDGVPCYPWRGAPYRLTMYNEQDATARGSDVGANADILMAATHNGTHLDALSHVFAGGSMYNGHPAASFTPGSGAARCGIEKVGGVVAPAVLLDLAAGQGVPWLAPGTGITRQMIVEAERRQGVRIGAGDVVLLHTGWMRWYLEEAERGGAPSLDVQPGLGRDGAGLLAERDVSLVGADNLAVEVLSPSAPVMDLHVEMIVRRGITFLEGLDLRAPVDASVAQGMLVLAPLRITGGSGSPVNPLLVV